MLSITELKEIKQQLDKGLSVSFPYTSVKEYKAICKQLDNYIKEITKWLTLISVFMGSMILFIQIT